MNRSAIITAAAALAVVGASVGVLASQQAGASTGDTDWYIPRSVIVGPNSTWFTITDESRGPAKHYVCAFLSPRDTGRNTGGSHPLEIYVPAIQCNEG